MTNSNKYWHLFLAFLGYCRIINQAMERDPSQYVQFSFKLSKDTVIRMLKI